MKNDDLYALIKCKEMLKDVKSIFDDNKNYITFNVDYPISFGIYTPKKYIYDSILISIQVDENINVDDYNYAKFEIRLICQKKLIYSKELGFVPFKKFNSLIEMFDEVILLHR